VNSIHDHRRRDVRKICEEQLGVELEIVSVDPPFSEDDDIDTKGYWFHPKGRTSEDRRKALRKQVFSSLAVLLSFVAQHQPQIILGFEQGAVIALLASFPLILESACRARMVTLSEWANIRKAWSKMICIVGFNPLFLPQRSRLSELELALPEMSFRQPRGLYVYSTEVPQGYRANEFARDWAPALGTV